VGCVPVKDRRTRSKIAAAKKADIHVLDTKKQPPAFALSKYSIAVEHGFLRIAILLSVGHEVT
jgi:hypothetical protein